MRIVRKGADFSLVNSEYLWSRFRRSCVADIMLTGGGAKQCVMKGRDACDV